jgi:hypothetical protein
MSGSNSHLAQPTAARANELSQKAACLHSSRASAADAQGAAPLPAGQKSTRYSSRTSVELVSRLCTIVATPRSVSERSSSGGRSAQKEPGRRWIESVQAAAISFSCCFSKSTKLQPTESCSLSVGSAPGSFGFAHSLTIFHFTRSVRLRQAHKASVGVGDRGPERSFERAARKSRGSPRSTPTRRNKRGTREIGLPLLDSHLRGRGSKRTALKAPAGGSSDCRCSGTRTPTLPQ